MATNASHRLVPWADVLYGSDASWWRSEGGVPRFAGMKISRDPVATDKYPDIRKVRLRKLTGSGWSDDMLFDRPGEIGWGGNSGFQAVNLAAHFGARTIVLIGLDATLEHGVHWHGKHSSGLNNPTPTTAGRWRKALDAAAPQLVERGITVLNASPISALEAYRKIDFCEYFGIAQ